MIHRGETWFIPFELSSLKGSSTKWAVWVETIIFHDCIVQDKEGKKGTQKSIMQCSLADHWLCLFKTVVILKTFIHRLKLVCWKIHIFVCMQSACQGWFIVKLVKKFARVLSIFNSAPAASMLPLSQPFPQQQLCFCLPIYYNRKIYNLIPTTWVHAWKRSRNVSPDLSCN